MLFHFYIHKYPSLKNIDHNITIVIITSDNFYYQMSPVLIECHLTVGPVESGPKQGAYINSVDLFFLNFFQSGVVLSLLPFYFLQVMCCRNGVHSLKCFLSWVCPLASLSCCLTCFSIPLLPVNKRCLQAWFSSGSLVSQKYFIGRAMCFVLCPTMRDTQCLIFSLLRMLTLVQVVTLGPSIVMLPILLSNVSVHWWLLQGVAQGWFSSSIFPFLSIILNSSVKNNFSLGYPNI